MSRILRKHPAKRRTHRKPRPSKRQELVFIDQTHGDKSWSVIGEDSGHEYARFMHPENSKRNAKAHAEYHNGIQLGLIEKPRHNPTVTVHRKDGHIVACRSMPARELKSIVKQLSAVSKPKKHRRR